MMGEERALGSRYRLLTFVGRGAMGEVWRGVDDAGRVLAVKLLLPHLVSDADLVSRFVAERSVLTGVRHPNVVSVVDLVAEGSTLAIVMPFVEGEDLRAALVREGTLAPAEACRVGAAVAAGLAAIHDERIYHRDIKPENILLDRATEPVTPRITDFGVSKLAASAEARARSTMLVGTPNYLAPELADGAGPSVQSDLYALGVVLYELCCGVTPFQGRSTMAVLRGHAERAPGRPGGFPRSLWDVVTWLLHKQPGERPGSARDVEAALQRVGATLGSAAPLAPLSEPPVGPLVTGPATTTVAGSGAAPGGDGRQDTVGTIAVPAAALPRPGSSFPGGAPAAGWSPGTSAPGVSFPGYGTPGLAPPAGAPPGNPSRRSSVLVPVLVALLVLVGAGAGLFAARMRGDEGTAPVAATIPTGSVSAPAAPPAAPAPTPTPTSAPGGGSVQGPLPTGGLPAPAPAADVDAQSRASLGALREQSLASTSLNGRYVLQLDSKWEGVSDPRQTASDGSHVFQARDILARHQSLKQRMSARGVPVLLLASSDFGRNTTSGHGTIWTTLADPGTLSTEAQANSACASLFPTLSGSDLKNACLPRTLTPPQ